MRTLRVGWHAQNVAAYLFGQAFEKLAKQRGRAPEMFETIELRKVAWLSSGKLEIANAAGQTMEESTFELPGFDHVRADLALAARGYRRVSEWSALGRFHRAVVS